MQFQVKGKGEYNSKARWGKDKDDLNYLYDDDNGDDRSDVAGEGKDDPQSGGGGGEQEAG